MTDKQIGLLDDHVLVLGYGDLTEPILEELDARDGTKYAVVTTDRDRCEATGANATCPYSPRTRATSTRSNG